MLKMLNPSPDTLSLQRSRNTNDFVTRRSCEKKFSPNEYVAGSASLGITWLREVRGRRPFGRPG